MLAHRPVRDPHDGEGADARHWELDRLAPSTASSGSPPAAWSRAGWCSTRARSRWPRTLWLCTAPPPGLQYPPLVPIWGRERSRCSRSASRLPASVRRWRDTSRRRSRRRREEPACARRRRSPTPRPTGPQQVLGSRASPSPRIPASRTGPNGGLGPQPGTHPTWLGRLRRRHRCPGSAWPCSGHGHGQAGPACRDDVAGSASGQWQG